MSKVRPSCQSAMPQSMRSLSKRQTRFDRLVEDGAQGALRPSCPTDEAINPNRQAGVQRKKRSTPIAERVSSGRRTNVKLQPPDWTEDEGPASTPSFRPALPAKDQRQLRIGSNSLVGDHSGERIILRSYPCNRDHAPRFLWSETLEKAKQCSHYRGPETRKRGPAAPLSRIAAKSFTKLNNQPVAPPARLPTTTVRS